MSSKTPTAENGILNLSDNASIEMDKSALLNRLCAAAAISEQCILDLDSESLSTRLVNKSNTTILTFDTEIKWQTEPQEITFGVNPTDVIEALNDSNLNREKIVLTLEDGNNEILLRDTKRTSHVQIHDPDELRSKPEIPTIEHNSSISVSAMKFHGMMTAVATQEFPYHVADAKIEIMTALGMLKVTNRNPQTPDKSWDIQCEKGHGVGGAIISPPEIQQLIQALPAAQDETIEIKVGIDDPVTIQYEDITFIIAPRTFPEDEMIKHKLNC
jgi:hypothetical protein